MKRSHLRCALLEFTFDPQHVFAFAPMGVKFTGIVQCVLNLRSQDLKEHLSTSLCEMSILIWIMLFEI